MSIFGYQSDISLEESSIREREESLIVRAEDISPILSPTLLQNTYVLTKNNIILTRNISLKSTGGTGLISGIVLRFPVPLLKGRSDYIGSVFTRQGTHLSYRMNSQGQLALNGTISDVNEEIYLNLAPYVAEFPIRYADIDFTTTGGNFTPIP